MPQPVVLASKIRPVLPWLALCCAAACAPDPDGAMTEAEAERADQTPTVPLDLRQIVLPNGLNAWSYALSRGFANAGDLPGDVSPDTDPPVAGPQQRRNDLIDKMLVEAKDLMDRTAWQFKDQNGMPTQNGLAYIYGGRDPSVLTNSSQTCNQPLHGLDCSGMFDLLAQHAGLQISGTAADDSEVSTWDSALPPAWGVVAKPITEQDDVQTGDIIAWPVHGHIGIVLTGGDEPIVAQSNGRKNPSAGQCTSNRDTRHGPRTVPLDEMLGWFPGETPVQLRLTATLLGTWAFHLRCADQGADAAVYNLTISTLDNGQFTAMGSGTDYNGTPLSLSMNGTFNQITNTLTATESLVGDKRVDSLTEVLALDDTGYFPLKKVVDNGGCAAQGRLVRLTITPVSEQ
jgi:hypothetical protein